MTKIVLADSGRVASDAGGGISGGSEMRGKVWSRPAEVTWKNDTSRLPDPKPLDVQPLMRETVTNIQTNTSQLDSLNVNSGKRPFDPANPNDPHADGRAVDINKINGVNVKDLQTAQGPVADRARQAEVNMVRTAMDDPNVNQILGPSGCWNRNAQGKWERIPRTPDNAILLDRHTNHYHINIYRVGRWLEAT